LITSTGIRKLAGGEDQTLIKGGVTEPLRKLLADWEGAHRGRGRRTRIVAKFPPRRAPVCLNRG